MDKEFDKPTYLLFKGKLVREGMGMVGRIPTIKYGDEVEEGPTEEGDGKKLKWSL